jgi:hypothetical protein
MAGKQIAESWHLSLTIGKTLWDDLIRSALPYKVQDGTFDLGRLVYQGVRQLQVKEKVAALLEDRSPPAAVLQVRDRAADLWRDRRKQVYRTIDQIFHVEGDWKLEVDREGTEFHYSEQRIGVDAHVKAVATGRLHLLQKNVEIPFTIEKRIGASCHLGDIRFDKDAKAIVGTVQDPGIDLGDHMILRMLNEAAGILLQRYVEQYRAVPILPKAQVEELVAPAGGPLRIQMGVEDVALDVNEENLTLKVRFGFTTKQIGAGV